MSGLLGLLLFLFCSALPSHAGREEEEKRTTPREQKRERKPTPKASPVKAYTNDDLKKPSPGSEGSDAAAPSTAAEEPAVYSGEGSESPVLVEEDWRSRASERRKAIEAADAAIGSLEEEAKALGLRIIMSSDTNEILELRARQQELTEQLEQARPTLGEAKQALDDFETEARRAGVPPGWLREP